MFSVKCFREKKFCINIFLNCNVRELIFPYYVKRNVTDYISLVNVFAIVNLLYINIIYRRQGCHIMLMFGVMYTGL